MMTPLTLLLLLPALLLPFHVSAQEPGTFSGSCGISDDNIGLMYCFDPGNYPSWGFKDVPADKVPCFKWSSCESFLTNCGCLNYKRSGDSLEVMQVTRQLQDARTTAYSIKPVTTVMSITGSVRINYYGGYVTAGTNNSYANWDAVKAAQQSGCMLYQYVDQPAVNVTAGSTDTQKYNSEGGGLEGACLFNIAKWAQAKGVALPNPVPPQENVYTQSTAFSGSLGAGMVRAVSGVVLLLVAALALSMMNIMV